MNDKDKVRAHYNSHANAKPDFKQALTSRRASPAAPLRDFHNYIKRLMIKRFASNAPALLDLCCGRGGDIMKWFAFGVRYAKGLDISDGEVLEAARRFDEQKAKPEFRDKLDAEFEVFGHLGEEEWSDGQEYDVVSCMFALHYFCGHERSLKMFLHNVALNLKPGGIFMGTIPCGKRVMQLLRGRDVFTSAALKLEKRWQGDVMHEPFGQAYTCAITGTVTEGKGDSEGSLEYLTFMRPIEEILASHGIFPVRDYRDRQLEDCFDPADRGATLKHFNPRFPHADPSLESASAMNGTFVFRKADNAQPPARLVGGQPPPLPPPPEQRGGPGAGVSGAAEEEAAGERAAAAENHQGELEPCEGAGDGFGDGSPGTGAVWDGGSDCAEGEDDAGPGTGAKRQRTGD